MSIKAIGKKSSCHFHAPKCLKTKKSTKSQNITQQVASDHFQECIKNDIRLQARSSSELSQKHVYDCKRIENISKTALIKMGILEMDPEVFNCDQSAVKENESEKTILKTIKELILDPAHQEKKSYLERLKAEIKAILDIDSKHHGLQALDVLKICLKVENVFQNQKTKHTNLYLRKSETDLARAVVVNFKKHSFTILSKKYGSLQASGGFKKVTDAISVYLTENDASAKRMVRAVNKFEKKIYDSELEYEREYGHNEAIFSYPAKRDPAVTKTNLIQEAYDSDLYIYTANVAKEIRQKMPLDDILDIFIAIGDSIANMHKNGDVHRDLKAKNVLIRKNDDDSISVKVCDFGHANTPINHVVTNREPKVHGTLRYSPPELLEDFPEAFNPFEQQKAVDMYGLGSMLYELVTHEKTPWGHDVYVALKKTGKTASKATKHALSLQKSIPKELVENNPPPHENCNAALLWLAGQLLNPNPLLRMKIDEFQTQIHEIKTNFKKNP